MAVVLGLAFNGVVMSLVARRIHAIDRRDLRNPTSTPSRSTSGTARSLVDLNAVISFVIVAFVLFLVIKAYNRAFPEEEAAAQPTEAELLTQIRDELRGR